MICSISETAPLLQSSKFLEESPKSRPSNKFSRWQLRYLGFQKTSNLILFLPTAVLFSIFSTVKYSGFRDGLLGMNPDPRRRHLWFREGGFRLALKIHLWSVLPAGVLLPLQILPVLKNRYLYLHRIVGRLLMVQLMVGNITAIIIARVSLGGTFSTQMASYTMATMTTVSMYKAWTSILKLRIDVHRSWMLRTWAYACSILTMRIILFTSAFSIGKFAPNTYKFITTCKELNLLYSTVTNATSVASLYTRYPACDKLRPQDHPVHVVVNCSLFYSYPEEKKALFNMLFGISTWMAQMLHSLLVEVYLNASRDEDERLKKISVLRRRAAGLEE